MVREFDRASLEQRADTAKLNATLKATLTGKGLTFSAVDRAPFRAKLVEAGYYKAWREKFGPEVWTALEAIGGGLS